MPAILNRQPRETCKGTLEDVARTQVATLLKQETDPKINPEALEELKRIESVYCRKIG